MNPTERSIFTCNSLVETEKTLLALTGMVTKLTDTVEALSKKLDDLVVEANITRNKLGVTKDEWFEPKFIEPLVKGPLDRHSSAIAITGIPCSSKFDLPLRIVDHLRKQEQYSGTNAPTCWTTKFDSSPVSALSDIEGINFLEFSSLVNMLQRCRVPENSIVIIDLDILIQLMTLSEIVASIPHCNPRNAILIFVCNTTDVDGKNLRVCQPDAFDEMRDYEGECRCDNPDVAAVAPCVDVDLEPLFKSCLYRIQTTDNRFALRVPFKYDLQDGIGMRQR